MGDGGGAQGTGSSDRPAAARVATGRRGAVGGRGPSGARGVGVRGPAGFERVVRRDCGGGRRAGARRHRSATTREPVDLRVQRRHQLGAGDRAVVWVPPGVPVADGDGARESPHAVGLPRRSEDGVGRAVRAGLGRAQCGGPDHSRARDARRHEDTRACRRGYVSARSAGPRVVRRSPPAGCGDGRSAGGRGESAGCQGAATSGARTDRAAGTGPGGTEARAGHEAPRDRSAAGTGQRDRSGGPRNEARRRRVCPELQRAGEYGCRRRRHRRDRRDASGQRLSPAG